MRIVGIQGERGFGRLVLGGDKIVFGGYRDRDSPGKARIRWVGKQNVNV